MRLSHRPALLTCVLLITLGLAAHCLAEDPELYGGTGINTQAEFSILSSFSIWDSREEIAFRFPVTTTANIAVTPLETTFTSYSLFSDAVPTFSMKGELNIPGTFEFRDFTATLRLYPFHQKLENWSSNLEWDYSRIFELTPKVGYEGITLRGDFMIEGPETTVIDTFEITLLPTRVDFSMPALSLNIERRPSRVNLLVRQEFAGNAEIFSGVVDGVPIEISGVRFWNNMGTIPVFRDSFISLPSDPVDPPLIPEPSTGSLVGFALAVLVIRKRKHRTMCAATLE